MSDHEISREDADRVVEVEGEVRDDDRRTSPDPAVEAAEYLTDEDFQAVMNGIAHIPCAKASLKFCQEPDARAVIESLIVRHRAAELREAAREIETFDVSDKVVTLEWDKGMRQAARIVTARANQMGPKDGAR